jgi:hypothetical protein
MKNEGSHAMSLFILLDAFPVRALIPYIWTFVPLEQQARVVTNEWKYSVFNRDPRYWPDIFLHGHVWWKNTQRWMTTTSRVFTVEDAHQQFCFVACYNEELNAVVSASRRYHRVITQWMHQNRFARICIVPRGGLVIFRNLDVCVKESPGSVWFTLAPAFCATHDPLVCVHKLRKR